MARAGDILATMVEPSLLYDRYRIVRKLGSGAFATVYLADDQQHGEAGRHQDRQPVRRRRRAGWCGRPRPPPSSAITTSSPSTRSSKSPTRPCSSPSTSRDRPFASYYRERHAQRRRHLRERASRLCRALEHAHKRGVVHRDIKPENIMLVEGDSIDVRLMDFGVAQLEDRASITLDGDLVGTLAYMSPEQGEGKQVDSRSDVYSLALTLYEGFTGRARSGARSCRNSCTTCRGPTSLRSPSGRPDLPPALSDALERAMARDRYARPDAATLGRRLAQVAKVMPESSAVRDPGHPGPPPVHRSPGRPGPPGLPGRAMWPPAAFALCSLLYLLPRAPFYPEAGDPAARRGAGLPRARLAVRRGGADSGGAGASDVRVRCGMGRDLRGARRRRHGSAALEAARVGGAAAGGHPAGGDGLGGPGSAASDRGSRCAAGAPSSGSSAAWCWS